MWNVQRFAMVQIKIERLRGRVLHRVADVDRVHSVKNLAQRFWFAKFRVLRGLRLTQPNSVRCDSLINTVALAR